MHWKNCNLAKYYIITRYVNLRTFFNSENRLADKNLLFPCLTVMTGRKIFLRLSPISIPGIFTFNTPGNDTKPLPVPG